MNSTNTLLKLRIRDIINGMPELKGCRIGYHGNGQSTLIDSGNIYSPNYNIIILIEEVEANLVSGINSNNNDVVLREPERILNKTVVGSEFIGAGLSCGLTIVSGIGLFAGIGAEIPSAGASTVVVIAAWTGLTTQGIQCINGIVRAREAYSHPNDNSLQIWDSYDWYNNTILAIDAIGIISAGVGLSFAAKKIITFLTLKGSLPAEEVLSKMTNAQRIAVYREAVKKISSNKAAAIEFDDILKQFKGSIANRLRNDNAVIIRQTAGQVSKRISTKTIQVLLQQSKDVLTNTAGIATSAAPKSYVGNASGSINYVINVITGD